MANDKLPPRRRSLRTVTPKKPPSEKPVESGVTKDTVKKRHPRRPRTYARRRHDEEESAIRAARSATISLETKNCGEGRVSLGTNAVPLPELMGGVDESKFHDGSSSDDSDTGATYHRKQGRKRRQEKDAEKESEEDNQKLADFMKQQKRFWNEVDEYLFEELEAEEG